MKLVLIDGSNLIFRAYYATEKNNITNPKGESVNALYTIISMIEKIKNDFNPDYFFIAMDSGKATFRHKMYDDYKGKRISIPEKLRGQFSLIEKYFEASNFKYYSTDEYEADDLIASYAKQASEKGIDVQVISGDKDLLQLVRKNVNVLTPKMGFSKEINYDEEVFFNKYTFPTNRFIEYKALVGDTSDNIIGISKLGDKTAKKFLNEYENLEDIFLAAKSGNIKGKIGENIINGIDNIYKNIKLVTLIDEIDTKFTIDELKLEKLNVEKYSKFLKEQGFLKLYDKFLKENITEEIIKDRHEEDKLQYNRIENFEIQEHTGTEITFIYTQNLEDNYFLSENLGIGIVSNRGNYYLKLKDVNDEFITFLKEDQKKVIYNSKRLMVVLNLIKIKNIIFDPYLALSLLKTENFNKPIDVIFHSYNIFYIKSFDEVYGTKVNPQIPDFNILEKDIISKTYAVFESFEKIKKDIEEQKLENVLYNIEMPLTYTLADMELTGIYIDKKELDKLIDTYEKKKEKIIIEISKYTDININSTAQLSDFLFIDKNLPKKGIKKTTRGYSTDVTNLEKLLVILNESFDLYKDEILFINNILIYRKISKILSTYLLNITKFILKDDRIHPINNQLLSETGRLSVSDPNIQNVPISSEEGQYIRSLFKSKTGNKIIAFDYSQVELRIMADFSEDENMISDFNKGLDIHKETAKRIFDLEEVSNKTRSRAKAINFGIIYGMSSYGLAKQVNISNTEAKDFIDKYFLTYPNIKKYMDSVIKTTEDSGFVTTISKRRRNVININSKNFNEREHAKRMAINTPIQGSAADILKLAIINVYQELEKQKLKSKMIMQIHDEIVFELAKDEETKIIDVVTKIMENVVDLKVKLKVDYGIGENWLQTK